MRDFIKYTLVVTALTAIAPTTTKRFKVIDLFTGNAVDYDIVKVE